MLKKKAFPYGSTQNIGVHSVNAVRPASHNVAFRNQSCKLQKDVLAFCIVPAPRTAEAELVKNMHNVSLTAFSHSQLLTPRAADRPLHSEKKKRKEHKLKRCAGL